MEDNLRIISLEPLMYQIEASAAAKRNDVDALDLGGAGSALPLASGQPRQLLGGIA